MKRKVLEAQRQHIGELTINLREELKVIESQMDDIARRIKRTTGFEKIEQKECASKAAVEHTLMQMLIKLRGEIVKVVDLKINRFLNRQTVRSLPHLNEDIAYSFKNRICDVLGLIFADALKERNIETAFALLDEAIAAGNDSSCKMGGDARSVMAIYTSEWLSQDFEKTKEKPWDR